MRNPSNWIKAQLIYRRILGNAKELRRGIYTVQAASFFPKPGEESLSVFLATKVPSRRYVLQHHINEKLKWLEKVEPTASDKQKIDRQRAAAEQLTVEDMYRQGWRVVEFPLSLIPADVFQLDPPHGEADGHLNIIGNNEAFETYTDKWAEGARILTEVECLQS